MPDPDQMKPTQASNAQHKPQEELDSATPSAPGSVPLPGVADGTAGTRTAELAAAAQAATDADRLNRPKPLRYAAPLHGLRRILRCCKTISAAQIARL